MPSAKRRKRAPGAGRPPSDNPARHVISFRVTDEELRAYELCAAAERVTVPRWARAVANRYVSLGGPPAANRALFGEPE